MILAAIILWFLFINVMTWKKYKDKIPEWVLPFLYVVVYIAYAWDIIFNILFGSIIFMQVPKHATLSARLSYNLVALEPETWRWKMSYFVCRYIIEPWDWNHCGLKNL